MVWPLLAGMAAISAILGSAARDGHRARQRALESLAPVDGRKVEGPLISIVIPTYNEESYLATCLTSIENQTYGSIEVIVADSSEDLTPQIAQAWGAAVVTVHYGNISRARNEGAWASRGDILLFLDADSIMARDTLERLVRALHQPGKVLAWGGQYALEDGDHILFFTLSTRFRRRWSTTGRGVAVWRWAFQEVGGYNEMCNPLEGCREDIDLGRRVRDRFGYDSIAYLKDAVVASSMRREKVYGYRMWRVPAVR